MTARINLYQELGLPRTTATSEIDKRLERFIHDQLSAGKDRESLRSLETSRQILGNPERRRVYDLRLDNKDSGPLDAQALYNLAEMEISSEAKPQAAADAPRAASTPQQPQPQSSRREVPEPAGQPTSQPGQGWGFAPVKQTETHSFEEVPDSAHSVSAMSQHWETDPNRGSQWTTVHAPIQQSSSTHMPPTQIQPATPVQPVQPVPAAQPAQVVQPGYQSTYNSPPAVAYYPEPELSDSASTGSFYHSRIVPAVMMLYLLASMLVRWLTIVEWTEGDEVNALRSLGIVTTASGMEKAAPTLLSLLVLAVSVLIVVGAMTLYAVRRHGLAIGLWIIAVVIDFTVGLVQAVKAMDWAQGTVIDLGFGPYVLMLVAVLGFVLAIGSVLFSRR